MATVNELRDRLVPYHKDGFKDLVALHLSEHEFKQLRNSVTAGEWLDWAKAAIILGDPEIQAVFSGICIYRDDAQERALALVARALEK